MLVDERIPSRSPSPPRAPAPQRDRHHDGGAHQLGAEDDDHPPEDVMIDVQDIDVSHDAVEAQRGDQRSEHEPKYGYSVIILNAGIGQAVGYNFELDLHKH